jgi:hypothetical protein
MVLSYLLKKVKITFERFNNSKRPRENPPALRALNA